MGCQQLSNAKLERNGVKTEKFNQKTILLKKGRRIRIFYFVYLKVKIYQSIVNKFISNTLQKQFKTIFSENFSQKEFFPLKYLNSNLAFLPQILSLVKSYVKSYLEKVKQVKINSC